jgi:hypothetical protein
MAATAAAAKKEAEEPKAGLSFNRHEVEKRKARIKRQKERDEKMATKLRYFGRVDSFVTKKPKVGKHTNSDDDDDVIVNQVFDISNDVNDDDNDNEKEEVEILNAMSKSLSRRNAILSTVPDPRNPTERSRLTVTGASGAKLHAFDWPETKIMMKLLQPFNLGCCCQAQCTSGDHHHEDDTTVLGVSRRTATIEGADDDQCLMPANPFNASGFELFHLLPEAFVTESSETNNLCAMTRFNNGATASELDRMAEDAGRNDEDAKQFASLMMRLRRQYFIELANIRATHERSRTQVDARHEADLICARKNEDDDYAEETKRARERERELVRNIFHSSIETLHGAIWSELKSRRDIPLFRRNLQREHATRLASALLRASASMPTDARAQLRADATLLRAELAAPEGGGRDQNPHQPECHCATQAAVSYDHSLYGHSR